jgi:hypothetical protein
VGLIDGQKWSIGVWSLNGLGWAGYLQGFFRLAFEVMIGRLGGYRGTLLRIVEVLSTLPKEGLCRKAKERQGVAVYYHQCAGLGYCRSFGSVYCSKKLSSRNQTKQQVQIQ